MIGPFLIAPSVLSGQFLLDCAFLIAPSVLSGQFLWIVYFWLPLRYYLARFSGLCIFDCPFGIIWPVSLDCAFLIAPSVLSVQFLWIVHFNRPSIFSKVYIHVCIKINPCHYFRRVFILIFYARNTLFSLLRTFYNSIRIECKSLTSHETTGIYFNCKWFREKFAAILYNLIIHRRAILQIVLPWETTLSEVYTSSIGKHSK